MDDHRFDDLTKALGSGMGSRRAALRLMTGSGLGVLDAWFGGAEVAEAKNKDKHKRKHKDKKKDKKKDKRKKGCAGCPVCHDCVNGECEEKPPALCDPRQCQIQACDSSTNGYVCESTCEVGNLCCNGRCCNGDRECCNGLCQEKASGPWTPCGGLLCCRGDQVCCNGSCRPKAAGPWTPCNGRIEHHCCPADWECCNGLCRDKRFGPYTPCGDTCCGLDVVGIPMVCCPGGYCATQAAGCD